MQGVVGMSRWTWRALVLRQMLLPESVPVFQVGQATSIYEFNLLCMPAHRWGEAPWGEVFHCMGLLACAHQQQEGRTPKCDDPHEPDGLHGYYVLLCCRAVLLFHPG